VKRADDPSDRRAVRAEVTALGRKRQAAGTPVVNAVLQDVANKLAAVDSQKLNARWTPSSEIFLAHVVHVCIIHS